MDRSAGVRDSCDYIYDAGD